MHKLILLFFLVTASCGTQNNTNATQTTVTNASVQEGVTVITLEETVQIANLNIYFKQVIEDSRCPTQVTCIWQGRVKILVETYSEGEDRMQHEIIFGKLRAGETENHSFYSDAKVELKATAVNPYPVDDTAKDNLPYKFVFVVRAK